MRRVGPGSRGPSPRAQRGLGTGVGAWGSGTPRERVDRSQERRPLVVMSHGGGQIPTVWGWLSTWPSVRNDDSCGMSSILPRPETQTQEPWGLPCVLGRLNPCGVGPSGLTPVRPRTSVLCGAEVR